MEITSLHGEPTQTNIIINSSQPCLSKKDLYIYPQPLTYKGFSDLGCQGQSISELFCWLSPQKGWCTPAVNHGNVRNCHQHFWNLAPLMVIILSPHPDSRWTRRSVHSQIQKRSWMMTWVLSQELRSILDLEGTFITLHCWMHRTGQRKGSSYLVRNDLSVVGHCMTAHCTKEAWDFILDTVADTKHPRMHLWRSPTGSFHLPDPYRLITDSKVDFSRKFLLHIQFCRVCH